MPGKQIGMVGIHFNHLLVATLTLFQPEGADYAHPIENSQPTFILFRRACIPFGSLEGGVSVVALVAVATPL